LVLAAAATVGWLWSSAPTERTLKLDLGPHSAAVTELEFSCSDDHGLAAGARLSFPQGAPRHVERTLRAQGAHLRCDIALRNTKSTVSTERDVQLAADSVTLPLFQVVDALRDEP
jgi:hypothetical protein